jgi:hypothetical protein
VRVAVIHFRAVRSAGKSVRALCIQAAFEAKTGHLSMAGCKPRKFEVLVVCVFLVGVVLLPSTEGFFFPYDSDRKAATLDFWSDFQQG